MTSAKKEDLKDPKPKKEAKQSKPLTKVVIRRLPPKLKEDEFIEVVGPLADYDYFRYVPADKNLEYNTFSRAYINFVKAEDVFHFKEMFDGYVFIDMAGNESQCLVEYAPYQKVSTLKKPKKDAKVGTIDDDADFLAFLEDLKLEAESHQETPENFLEEIERREKENKLKETTTPLLLFAREKNAEKLEKRRKTLEYRKQVKEEKRKKAKEQLAAQSASDSRKKEPPKPAQNVENNASAEKKAKGRKEGRKKAASVANSEDADDLGEGPKKTKRYSDRRRDSSRKEKDSATKVGENVEEISHDFHQDGDEKSKQTRRERREQRELERAEKRLKNKERPALQIYRPGMGKFSSQTISKESKQPSEESADNNSREAALDTAEDAAEKADEQLDASNKKHRDGGRNLRGRNRGRKEPENDRKESEGKVYATREFRRSHGKNPAPAEEENPAREAKKPGKSYSSKRRERQQQKERNSQDGVLNIPDE